MLTNDMTFMKFFVFLSLEFFLCCKGFGQTIRMAVSANAQFVAQALKESFEKQHPGKLELVVGSSGKLTAQIEQGAPYAVFLSADMGYPQELYKKGFSVASPRVYAYGKLVLWTLKDLAIKEGLKIVQQPAVKTIAIGNPAVAPYGVAAMEAMKKVGVYDKIKNKIVYGESIAQVNQYLLTGAADLVFTAKSVVEDPAMKNKGQWIEVNDSLYQPIEQGVVVLKQAQGDGLEYAQDFYHFLFSAPAKAIFTAYGYRVK